MISIMLSLAMLTKTAIFFEMFVTRKSWKLKLAYFTIHLPFYILSAYFRLGSIALSTIFFGVWSLVPLIVLLFLLVLVGRYKSFDWNDMAMTLPSNLFVVSHK